MVEIPCGWTQRSLEDAFWWAVKLCHIQTFREHSKRQCHFLRCVPWFSTPSYVVVAISHWRTLERNIAIHADRNHGNQNLAVPLSADS